MSINWPSAPAEGDSYTYNGIVYRYRSGAWMPSAPAGYSTTQQWSKTATAGQTAFTGADDLSVVLATNGPWTNVFLNGRILSPGLDYTLTAATVTLLAAAKVGDICTVVTIFAGLMAVATLPNADNTVAPATTGFVHNYAMPLTIPAKFKANKNNVDQTIANNTPVKITATNEVFDVGGFYDAANSKWVPPAGLVVLVATAQGSNLDAGAAMFCTIYKNGADMGTAGSLWPGSTATFGMTAVALDMANGTDYYEIFAFAFTSLATGKVVGANNRTTFSGFWLGL